MRISRILSPVSRRDRGQAVLPLVVSLVLLLGLIGVTLATAAFLQTQLSGQRLLAEQTRQAAQSGVNDALLRIARNKDWPPSFPSTYSLTINGPISTSITITDTSTVTPPRTRRSIESKSQIRNVARKLRVEIEVSPSGGVTVLRREETSD